MSYEWQDKCKENCGGYPQPYRPPGSRGPFGVPYRTLLSKNCLQTKNQTKKIADWEFLPTGFGSLRDG